MIRTLPRLFLALALTLALPACGDDDDTTPTDQGTSDLGSVGDLGSTTDQGGPGMCTGTIGACAGSVRIQNVCVVPGCTPSGEFDCAGTPTVTCDDATDTIACNLWNCTWEGNAVCEANATPCQPGEVCCADNNGALICANSCN